MRFQDLIDGLIDRFKNSNNPQVIEDEIKETHEEAKARAFRLHEIEDFFNSELGKYIESRLEKDRGKLLVAISELSPGPQNDYAIRELQRQLKVINTVRQYIEQAIVEGTNAIQILVK